MSEPREKDPPALAESHDHDDEGGATATLDVSRDTVTASGDDRAKRIQELRLKKRAEPGVPEATVWRLRAGPDLPAGAELLPEEDPPGGLVLAGGKAGEAEICLGKGDTDGARKLAASLTDSPDNAGPPKGTLSDDEALGRTVSVRAHLMDGNLDAARAMIGRARDDERLALADAALSLGEGNVKRAKERMEGALQKNPTGLAEHYTLALIHVAEGEVHEAMDLLGRVAASCPEHAVARHQLGQLTLAAGDAARAGTLFEMATQLAPTFIPPALALAEMLVESRQYGEAMNVLSGVTERVPNALSPRLLQLRVLLDLGEHQSALGLAEALKTAAPDHYEITSLWAESLLANGRGDETKGEVQRLLPRAIAEDKARLFRILARVELAESPPRVLDAVQYLEQAVSVAPLPGELRLELAQLHLSVSSADEAIEVLGELGSDPRSDLGDLLSGAVMARNHGLYGAARKLAQAALLRVNGTPAEGQISAFLHSLPAVD